LQLPAEAPVTPALSLGAERLAGRPCPFEFLPPRISAFQQFTARYSSGPLRTAGAGAVGVLILVAGLFCVQQWQLARWRSQWLAIAPKVNELQGITQKIHDYRPWFDESARALAILRQLTLAFPEEGSVSAKTIEIRDLSAVSCSGVASDNRALLKTLEKLRDSGGVSDLKVVQIRGKAPMQFTFDYHWTLGGSHEN
jgi:hypothetical protein